MKSHRLSDKQLAQALETLHGWEVRGSVLHKDFHFTTFAAAIGWMVSVAFHAERLNHHPEWINVYNRVSVDLVTHDLGNVISNLDLELAKQMDLLKSSTTEG